MATPDEQMNIYLNIINTAVKGKDMRSALHDSIEKTYNDAYDWADEAIGKANQAFTKADNAEQTAQGMASQIEEVEDIGEEIEGMYDELTGRIDNIIAHNNDTEGNTELIDIRTDYQGYTGTSAGSSVRRQERILNDRMNQIVRTFPTTQVQASVPLTVVRDSIWENDSPTAAFAGDTISFINDELVNAAQVAIIFKNNKSDVDTYEMVFTMPNSSDTCDVIAQMPIVGSYGTDVLTRKITLSDSSIVFDDCYSLKANNPFSLSDDDLTISDPSTTSTEDNDYLIPVEIFSVKLSVVATLTVQKDSEITDARVGIDDTVYASLGEAIRTQVAQYTAAGIIEALNGSY